MTTFTSDVNRILQDKGYNKPCHSLQALAKAVDKNSQYTNTKIRSYKWTGLLLLTSVPLMSALLSVSVGLKTGEWQWLQDSALPLSVTLTVFTILNSIFKPSERFREACLIGIGIERFRADLSIALEKLPRIDEVTLAKLVDDKRTEFEAYQVELIGMLMPTEVGAQKKLPAPEATNTAQPPRKQEVHFHRPASSRPRMNRSPQAGARARNGAPA